MKRFMYVLATGLDSTDASGGVVEADNYDRALAIVARYEELLYDEDATDEDAEVTDFDEGTPLSAHEYSLLEKNLDERQGVLDVKEIPEKIEGGIVSLCHASNG